MSLPVLEIHLNKIRENAVKALAFARAHGVEPVGITKVFCAEPRIAELMLEAGFTMLGDSRLDNLQRIAHLNVPKMLIRLPMPSEAGRAVELTDFALISARETACALSEAARKRGKRYGVVLMLELGDLREGCPDEASLLELAELCARLPNLYIQGVGGNLICYGGVVPSAENQRRLVSARHMLEDALNIRIPWISGGNSAVETLMEMGGLPAGVNQLRMGALVHLGIGLKDRPVPGYHQDAYTIRAEVIERNVKPTMPYGEIGTDAFGKVRAWEDRGDIQRAIVALGRADCEPDSLYPEDPGIKILGGSSDHLILDVMGAARDYRVGDSITFVAQYVSVLRASISPYVKKAFV